MVIVDEIKNGRGEVIGTRERVEDHGEWDRVPGVPARRFIAYVRERDRDKLAHALAVWRGSHLTFEPSNRMGTGRGIVDLENGHTFRDAREVMSALGVKATSHTGLYSAIRRGMRYHGRWLEWDTPELKTADGRAAALRQRLSARHRITRVGKGAPA